MRKLTFIVALFFAFGCSDSELPGDFTGEELNYTLFSGSDFEYEGGVTIREKNDGSAQLVIQLSGPTGESFFPAHLHFNSFDTPDAELAALLSPVSARSGESVTDLNFLSDDTEVSYEDLVAFDGHIKIHLDDGINQDVILAFGNIGSNMAKLDGEAALCNGPN